MKYLLTFLILTISSLAGTITDNAKITNQSQLQGRLSSLPVFIETHSHLDNIKSYTDAKVAQLTDKGFLIVVTTNPREWRISMTPIGLVTGEQTRVIGERMVGKFKGGDINGGLLNAANELNNLIAPKVDVPVEKPIETTAKPKIVYIERKQEIGFSDYINIWVILIVCAGGITLFILAVSVSNKNEEIRGLNSDLSDKEYVNKKLRGNNDDLSREINSLKNQIKEIHEEKVKVSLDKKIKKMSPLDRTNAQKSWDSYPANVRREVINRYSSTDNYCSNVFSDPLYFYLFMQAVLPNETVYAPPPISNSNSYSSNSSDSDDSYRRSSNSSSDYSSSSSYDSSSSSFDSGSSYSDSGGSGGSW